MSERKSRREFISEAATAALALGIIPAQFVGCAAADGKADADTPITPAGDTLDRIGVQLYTVRTLMEKNVEDTLRQVAGIGYQEVEFAGYFNRAPSAIKLTLDSLGLAAPAAHVALNDLEGERLPRTLEAANTLGHRYLIVAWMPPEARKTMDDWKRISERFNKAGEAVKAKGMQFAYHNHDFEFVPIDGQVPMDVMLEATDPSLVRVELDLYWISMAGGDWRTYFARWPGRFKLVHVKDSAGPPKHEQRDVGAGSLPFATIFAQRASAGIEHFFVEHDNPPDPLASITASYNHLKQLTF
ncbi:MAG: sugar phosphate isomerase/epimerase family protein [Gemmatimonadaceae bacterium]